MDALKNNLISTFGRRGQAWIEALPTLILECSRIWNLTNVRPRPSPTWNFVAETVQFHRPAILKLGFDTASLEREIEALKVFTNTSAIDVFEYNSHLGAVLLESADPGLAL